MVKKTSYEIGEEYQKRIAKDLNCENIGGSHDSDLWCHITSKCKIPTELKFRSDGLFDESDAKNMIKQPTVVDNDVDVLITNTTPSSNANKIFVKNNWTVFPNIDPETKDYPKKIKEIKDYFKNRCR